MLVCTSCNIEYKEDKKFCSYCGGPLVTKEDLMPSEKYWEKEEREKPDQKLICPTCKITYEFGSSCIQCGSPLVREISSKGKEVLETNHKKSVDERERVQLKESQEPQIKKSHEKQICPACKIIYERGNVCIKCGSALVPQTSIKAKEKSKLVPEPEADEKPILLRTLQEQLIDAPHKKLICPTCKIIYERGNACIRCGSALVTEIPGQEVKLNDTEITPWISQPENQGDVVPPIHVPKGERSGDVQRAKKKEPETIQSQKTKKELQEIEEVSPGTEAPEQLPTKRSADDLGRTSIRPRTAKLDYRRLFFEVGSISVMVLAGGYFLWSIYSHLNTKPTEPKTLTSKEIQSLDLPKPSIPTDTTPTISIPQESDKRKIEQSSAISKDKTEVFPPIPSHPTSSDDVVVETLEIRKIKDLLDHIRQANLEKNIDLFISCYAMDFKDREGKKKATLAYWRNFDYLDLSYALKNPFISGETAKARVEWVIRISPKTGKQPQESKSILDVILKKEDGGWKVKEVKQVD
jgi:hypothetical protein